MYMHFMNVMIHFIVELQGNKKIYNRFSMNQVKILKTVFKESPYPDYSMKVKLSNEFNVTLRVITRWFEYRRYTQKGRGKMH